jgi:hypothetical protein
VIAIDSSTDSFLASIDGGADLDYHTGTCVHVPGWSWAPLRDGIVGCPAVAPSLRLSWAAGGHTVRLRSREGRSIADRIVITEDPAFVPSDGD